MLNKRLFQKNKGRNLAAVTAIALTTLMFTTLFVLSQSMNKNLIEMTFRQTGYDAQISFKDITAEQAEKIAAHPDVAEVGQSMVVGIGRGLWQEGSWRSVSRMKAMQHIPLQRRLSAGCLRRKKRSLWIT